jgi:RNA polymerase sigma-70 factor (ECF subfamily)
MEHARFDARIRVMDATAPDIDAPPAEPPPASATVLDEDAFRAAFHEHGASVLRYATSRVGPIAGEDVAADTFVEAWRSRHRYDGNIASIEAWLLGIATRVIARQRRAERRWLQMCADTAAATSAAPDPAPDPLDRIDAAARRPELAASLRRLTIKERDPLLLHLLADLTYDQIAAALRIPVGTVRSRISRARARVAADLEGGDHA